MNLGLARRIAKLEGHHGIREELPPVAQIILHPGDSQDEAMAKYRAEHPGLPENVRWVIIQLISPQRPMPNLAGA